MSQGSIVVATAPVTLQQHQLRYVGDYLELVTQECLCLLFGNMAAGILFLEKQYCGLSAMLHSRNLTKKPFVSKPDVMQSFLSLPPDCKMITRDLRMLFFWSHLILKLLF